ncbi:MAG TPA: glycosyltransferase family 4 protein [Candidatus Saccharimonadales bacterium]|nr:glycosyltransferase family 4 protein [Candidatus Saccharimonadales bacterium]
MRIGIYDPYLDTLGGGEKYMLTAASVLAKKHTVSLFWDDSSILEKARSRFGLDGDTIRFAPNIFTPKYSLLQRILLTQDYDAIFYLSDGSIPLLGAKKLYLHFQFPVEWVQKPSLLSYFKIKRVNAFICNSRFTKGYIDKKFGVKSKVLYPPVERFSESSLPKENMILSVGRFQKNSEGRLVKKQDVLIDTFKKMVDRGLKDWELVLMGGVLEKDQEVVLSLKENAKGYAIRIVSNVGMGVLHTAYCKAKIYWHASGFGEDLKTHPERAEHFGISTVEAMQKGAVPVVINAGGQKEIVADGANGYLWDTQEELEKRTQKIITDTSLWGKLSLEAIKDAQNFTKDRFAEELTKLIV